MIMDRRGPDGRTREADPGRGEIETLRARLDEAEATLRAIRNGEVDALVVSGPYGQQVYTLHSAEEPYRLLIERIHEGALTLTLDGGIRYANHAMAQLLGLPLEQVIGQTVERFVAPADHPAWTALLAEGCAGGRREVGLAVADGTIAPVQVSVSPLTVDGVDGLCAVVTDLTGQKLAEEVASAGRLARLVLDHATEAMVVCDLDGIITHASQAAQCLSGRDRDLIGRSVAEALALRFMPSSTGPAEAEAASLDGYLAMVRSGTLVKGLDAELTGADGTTGYFRVSAGPLATGRKRIIGGIITLTDITDRRRAEEHQQMLMAELSHRVKNTLAVVQSIAQQSLKYSDSMADFSQAFNGRLQALAQAHSVLTSCHWLSADLESLIGEALGAYRPAGDPAIRLRCEPLAVTPSAAVALAMVIHELGTNSAKHGALAVAQGVLTVSAALEDGADGRYLRLVWHESGLTGLLAPSRVGFGTLLIRRTVTQQLAGDIDLSWLPGGLHGDIRIPWTEVAASPE